jgi:hypothetical protein
MSETVCARCDTPGESQWRIDFETDREGSTERTHYSVCRACWEEMTDRFAGPVPGER